MNFVNNKLEEVTPGYFDIGNGLLATLEQIYQLRTGRRNRGMNANCPEGRPPTTNPMRIVNLNRNDASHQEHLPLPSTMQSNEDQSTPCECRCGNTTTFQHSTQKDLVVNDGEHLPLPVMNFQKVAPKQTVNESEHLIPPSSHRNK